MKIAKRYAKKGSLRGRPKARSVSMRFGDQRIFPGAESPGRHVDHVDLSQGISIFI